MAASTTEVFDDFYNLNLLISSDQYDIVYSYFQSNTDNAAAAKSFTQTLFLIANETQINVLDLLETFKGGDKLKISLTMAYYLNSTTNKTVLFGINQVPTPNNLIQRNIVQ
jgi:hypothetical protein